MARSKSVKSKPIATITDLSHDGKGVTKVDGKVVFVTGALPGESVKFSYTKSKRSYDEAVVYEIITPSASRIIPKCSYFMLCGGCVLQHLSSDKQIEFKQKSLLTQLKQQSNITATEVLPAISGDTWGYRYKARLGVKVVAKKGGALVGFRELGSGFLAVMDSCEVLHPAVGHKISQLKNLINQMNIGNKIAQIEVAFGDNAGVLIFRNLIELPLADTKLLDEFGTNNKLHIYTQSGGPDAIKPLNSNHKIQLFYQTANLKFEFAPNNFTQINFSVNHHMIALAVELLNIQNTDNILDLFCGLGNFTLAIAQYAQQVLGLEFSASLVRDAEHNAVLNGIENATFKVLDLQNDIIQGSWLQQQWHKVVLDPPRSGAKEIISLFDKINPSHIVYVSCNPATLARDADILVNKLGYKLTKIGALDMFPHTAHIESIALFVK